MTDIARLGLEVDSTKVVAAIQALEKLKSTSRETEGFADALRKQTEKQNDANLTTAQSWLKQAASIDKTRGEIIRMEAAAAKMQGEALVAAEAAAKIFDQSDKAKKFEADFAALTNRLSLSAAAVATGFVTLMGTAVKAFAAAEEAGLRVDSMLKVTGGSAGRSAEQIAALGDELMAISRFDDDSIKLAAASMMRFGSIAGDSFDRSIKLSADLATALGTDITMAAEMVGRALENSMGVTQLRRTGLLSDAQVEYLQSLKDVVSQQEYQSQVLAALESRVGGMTEKMGQRGLAGATAALKNEMGEWLEMLGERTARITAMESALSLLTGSMREARDIAEALGGAWDFFTSPFSLPAVGFSALAARMNREPSSDESAAETARNERFNQVGAERDQARSRALAEEAIAVNKAQAAWSALYDTHSSKEQQLQATIETIRAVGKAAGQSEEEVQRLISIARENARDKTPKKDKEAEAETREVAKLIDEYIKLKAELDSTSKEYETYYKALDTIHSAFNKGLIDEQEAIEQVTLAYEKLHPTILADARLKLEIAKAEEEERKNNAKELADIEKQVKAEQEKARTLKLTRTELVAYTKAQIDANIAIVQSELAVADEVGAGPAYIQMLRDKIKAWEDLKVAVQEASDAQAQADFNKAFEDQRKKVEADWARTAENISNSLTDALLRGFESGKDFAENFRETLVNMFKTLVLRPIIQMVLAPIGGSISSLLGGAGSMIGGPAGNLMSAGSSLFGGQNPLSFLGGGGSNVGSFLTGIGGGGPLSELGLGLSGVEVAGTTAPGFMGPVLPAGGLGAFGAGIAAPFATIANGFGAFSGAMGAGAGFGSAMGAGLGAMGGIAGAVGAAVPIIGIGLAIAAALGAFDSGGPKTGGSASNIPGMERFFTPNQGDAQMMQIVDAQTAGFKEVLQSLGGSGAGARFGFGFDDDPEGDAQSRISVEAQVGGQSVYSVRDLDVGGDMEDVEKELKVHAQRALLAALQASDLPEEVARILDSVSASTATEKDIDNIIRVGAAIGTIVDLAGKDLAAEGLKLYEDGFKTLNETFSTAISDIQTMIDEFDGSTESMEMLAGAANDLYQAGVKAVAQINAIKAAVNEMFQADIQFYTMSQMNNEEKFNYLGQLVDQWAQELASATDVETINRLAGQISGAQREQFSLLTPEQQSSVWQDFVADAAAANALAQERLDLARDKLADQIEDMIKEVKGVLMAAAEKQMEAANAMLDAAGIMQDAANTPQVVEVVQPNTRQVYSDG